MDIYLPIADMAVNVFLVLGLGGLVGFLSGLFGIGGGFSPRRCSSSSASHRRSRSPPAPTRSSRPPSRRSSRIGGAAM